MKPISPDAIAELLCFAGIVMDTRAYRVRRAGRTVRLAPTEFRLLRLFLAHPRRVFTRTELLASVRDEATRVDVRTIDGHILRLRRALNRDGAADLIRTIRLVGYALAEGATELQLERRPTTHP